MKKLRAGVIGCGGISEIAHFPTYAKLRDQVELVAVADIDANRARACAERYGAGQVFDSAKSMLASGPLDLVSICTWNNSHAELAVMALEAGCDVLCEKPPAITVEEAERIADVAGRSGRILTYGFHYRYAPEVELMKKYADSGDLGTIYAARAMFLRRRGIPGWGVFANKELQGGGPLIDIGVHALDTVLHIMNYPVPKAVLGATYSAIGRRKGVGLLGEWDWARYSVEDLARGMILFEDGRSVILETSFAVNMEPRETLQLSFMGDKGGADLFPVTLLSRSDTPLKLYTEKHGTLVDVIPVHYVDPNISYHELEVRNFVGCCAERRQPYSTAEQGVILQKIICALYQSAETGGPVELSGKAGD